MMFLRQLNLLSYCENYIFYRSICAEECQRYLNNAIRCILVYINYVVLVREASDVLQLIDLNMEELDPFFREFNVLHTEGAEKGIDSFPAFLGASFNKNTGDSMVIILWLGGLCVFLFALLVLVLSLVSRLVLI